MPMLDSMDVKFPEVLSLSGFCQDSLGEEGRGRVIYKLCHSRLVDPAR